MRAIMVTLSSPRPISLQPPRFLQRTVAWFARRGVRFDVAEVVEHQDRGGQEPDAAAGENRQRRDSQGFDVYRSARRDQAEKDEDEQLAQPEISVRTRAARI